MLRKACRGVKAILVLLVVLYGGRAAAATVLVGDCKTGLVKFPTIQDAVNAVPPASTIQVCPGTYPEQVTISQPLTLKGIAVGTANAAVVTSPAGGVGASISGYGAQVLVLNTTGVNISNLIVDGSNNGISVCGGPILVGIMYANASGNLTSVVARNQRISIEPCSFGTDGILVRSTGGLTSNVTIQNSTVHHFGSNGIYAFGTGATVAVRNNSILGIPNSLTPGNGIDLAFGAKGVVTGNTLTDLVWAPGFTPSFVNATWGILLECVTGVTVSGNTITNSQTGIVVSTFACGASFPNPDFNSILNNKVFGSHTYDGIAVCGNSNLVQGNTIAATDQAAIHLASNSDNLVCPTDNNLSNGSNNALVANKISNAGCAGIIVDGSTSGNIVAASNSFATSTSTILSPGTWCAPPIAARFEEEQPMWREEALEMAMR